MKSKQQVVKKKADLTQVKDAENAVEQSNDTRQKPAATLRRSPWSPSALIDQGFLIFAGLASFWLAWLIWREGWHNGGWWLVGLFVVVWLVTAYIALPRTHRILSSLYVPNYFIGRTRTADGLLADPVNLALRGSEAQLHRAMTAAGWTLADEITSRSAWRMIRSIVMRRSYPGAPVSSLFLFGRRQDFTYQQEVDGHPGKRHHVRFWRCPQGWLLPGGHQVDWLAAGSYDRSVGVSLFTLQLTHRIDRNLDIERDYIVSSLTARLASIEVTNLKDFSTGYHSRNGGGDSIQTDGDLPVIELARVRARGEDSEWADVIADATSHEEEPEAHDTLLQQFWSRRPPQIAFGVMILALAILLLLGGAVIDLFNWQTYWRDLAAEMQAGGTPLAEAQIAALWIVIVMSLLALGWIGLLGWLAWRVFIGSNRARLLLLTLLSITAIISSFGLTVGKMNWLNAISLLFIGASIIVIVMLSSDAARRFTQARSAKTD